MSYAMNIAGITSGAGVANVILVWDRQHSFLFLDIYKQTQTPMKNFLTLAMLLCAIISCENAPAACIDTVPTDEQCRALYIRWFYDADTESCDEIKYNGCKKYGFASEEACLECAG